MTNQLRFLNRIEIDDVKWDHCVQTSINENPMGYSWFLDIMTQKWEGLVLGDYTAVMPIEFRKIGPFSLIEQSAYIQFNGFYADNNKIQIDFSKISNALNLSRWHTINLAEVPGFKIISDSNSSKKSSFILDLNKSYPEIYNAYNNSHKKNLRRFVRKYEKRIVEEKNASTFTRLKNDMTTLRGLKPIKTKISNRLESLIEFSTKNNFGEYYSVLNNDNKPVGCAFFLNGINRSIIFSASNNEGRETQAAFGLVDYFIQKHAGSNKKLDFAGSMIKGIAEFNKGFGADEVHYNYIYKNTNPKFILKLLRNA
ncbi:MAG: hypothetical protein JW717_13895 [Marinilabiliaceae bacterium]|nr:hypothetical protein [Marinilabiliaceae bacterium]